MFDTFDKLESAVTKSLDDAIRTTKHLVERLEKNRDELNQILGKSTKKLDEM